MIDIEIDVAAPEDLIRQEIERGATQTSVAMSYALALRNKNIDVDFGEINRMIINRWSVSGLERIKKLAWSGKCFK